MTNQQEKVYRFILNNRGCTTKDIMLETGIQCPSGRISELRSLGVKIEEIGTLKYPGSKAFVQYAIGKPLQKRTQHIEIVDGRAIETFKLIEV